MAVNAITEPASTAPQTADWQALLAKLVKVAGGASDTARLTNWDATTEPQVEAGSRFEINGTFYEVTANESITGWSGISDAATAYVYATPGTGTAAFSYSSTAPTWDSAKGGWYNGTARALFRLTRTNSTTWSNKRRMDAYSGLDSTWLDLLSFHALHAYDGVPFRITAYNTSGAKTHTFATGYKKALALVVGAGGGGGSYGDVVTSSFSGGGGGGPARALLLVRTLATLSFTLGAKGVGGVGDKVHGTAGGTTTIGGITLSGGAGGLFGITSTTKAAGGAVSGSETNIDILYSASGGRGGKGVILGVTGVFGGAGAGGGVDGIDGTDGADGVDGTCADATLLFQEVGNFKVSGGDGNSEPPAVEILGTIHTDGSDLVMEDEIEVAAGGGGGGRGDGTGYAQSTDGKDGSGAFALILEMV